MWVWEGDVAKAEVFFLKRAKFHYYVILLTKIGGGGDRAGVFGREASIPPATPSR